jgi:6-phosphofructokinase 1
MDGTAVVAHGGGPTIVMNASLAGVVEECRRHPEIRALYGARRGIQGVIEDYFVDLYQRDSALIETIAETPGSALGSCRRAVRDEDYERVLDVFRARGVRYFFYNGGNGSMYLAMRISRVAREAGYDLRVVGIPKTIDNDLAETDHTPGYGSTARFFACALRDIGSDIRELAGRVSVVEVMGRNVGWLAAATVLARHFPDDPPHLIYFPERPLAAEKLLADVERVYTRLGYAVVAVCEGQTDDKGGQFGADQFVPDGFKRTLSANLGHVLAQLIGERLKLRARSEKPGVLGRSSAAFASRVDRDEARMCGRAAVAAAISGATGKMVTLARESNAPYRSTTGLAELEQVAYTERRFPSEWINPEGNDVMPQFLEYVSPLAGEIEARPRL